MGNGNQGTECNVMEQIKIIHLEVAYKMEVLYTRKGTEILYFSRYKETHAESTEKQAQNKVLYNTQSYLDLSATAFY